MKPIRQFIAGLVDEWDWQTGGTGAIIGALIGILWVLFD